MTDIVISTAAPEDWDEMRRLVYAAFHDEPSDEAAAADRRITEIERALVARRDGEIVGTAAIHTRQLAIPGGVVPAAHVTQVSVAPTARRQGVLTRFMRRQFDDARAAGEPIAVLWASEGRIYQRFGYALGAARLALNVESNEVTQTTPLPARGRLREGSPAALRDALVKLYDEVFASHPGWSERAERHWDYRLADLKDWRHGGTELRAVIHEDDGVDGYVLWRGQSRWSDTGVAGEVRVLEQIATTPAAYAALWQFLLTMDLTRTVNVWSCAPDEPLLYAVNEPRRLDARLRDALWLRVLDVPAALAARRYAIDVNLVIEVTDDIVTANAGRWRLHGSATDAACVSTVDEPDLSCDVRTLGATYLGGAGFATLAATGQVNEHRPGALVAADTAFRWHRAPTSIEAF